MVYVRLPNFKNFRDHRYHYVRRNAQTWIDTEIIASGPWFPQTIKGQIEKEPHYSAGLTLDHSNPNRIVLSRLTANNQFEIEAWVTKDLGKTWLVKSITKESTFLNVRPIIPRHFPSDSEPFLVLWMSGKYQYWTNYTTSIHYSYVA